MTSTSKAGSFHTGKLPKTRPVGSLDEKGQGVVLEQPMPVLTKGKILVRVMASMITPGSHLGTVRDIRAGKIKGEIKPLGYQGCGYVAALGPGVTKYQVGDRVVCFGGDALHSPWVVVPQNLSAKIPDGPDFDETSAINLVLTGVQAMRRVEPVFGETLLVVGMGLVGQLTSQIAVNAGMSVIGADGIEARLKIARRCGGVGGTILAGKQDLQESVKAFTNGYGLDAAVMAIGGDGTEILQQVFKSMKVTPDTHAMGRIVLVGGLKTTCSWGASMGNIDLRCAARTGAGYHDKPWEIGEYDYPKTHMRWTTTTNLELALRWIASGKLKVKPMITHRLPLEKFSQAVNLLVETPQKALGVVVTTE